MIMLLDDRRRRGKKDDDHGATIKKWFLIFCQSCKKQAQFVQILIDKNDKNNNIHLIN